MSVRGFVQAHRRASRSIFFQVMGDIQQLLKPVFGTKDGVTTVISGTGSAGMEAAVSNFVEPGAKLAVFASGYFCDRISAMGKRQGAQALREALGQNVCN